MSKEGATTKRLFEPTTGTQKKVLFVLIYIVSGCDFSHPPHEALMAYGNFEGIFLGLDLRVRCGIDISLLSVQNPYKKPWCKAFLSAKRFEVTARRIG